MNGPIHRVIIAEEHAVVRRGIRNLIEADGRYPVVGEASDGIGALRLAEEEKPDIAILAYALPQLDGLSVSQRLRQVAPKVEILIYTTHDGNDVVASLLRAGVRGFVLKSDPESNLIMALDSLGTHQPFFSAAISERLLDRCLDIPREKASPLTHREREIVQLLVEGWSNREVARSLSIRVKTVETHRANIMRKLELKTIADLVRYAVRNNLILA